jgi:SagB-type dehydrogenase family enzyme
MNRLAFRGGTFAPVFPAGPHVGLVRPFWAIHNVTGLASGIWHYDPMNDRWHLRRPGDFRVETKYVSLEQRPCGNAAAACFVMSDLRTLMEKSGPDAYRLAHLEAGIVGQRVHLAAAALGLGSSGVGAFYDDEVRAFLDLEDTGWEAVFELVIGVPAAGASHPSTAQA